MKLLNKRAQVGNLAGFFMGIGVAAIVLVVVMIILQELQYSATSTGLSTGTNTTASIAAHNVIVKLGTAPTWIGLIILAGLAFIVLGFFMGRRGQ